MSKVLLVFEAFKSTFQKFCNFFKDYVVGSKYFRPDIQNRTKWKMLWGIYSAIYGEVSVSVEKCVEIKGDYFEK